LYCCGCVDLARRRETERTNGEFPKEEPEERRRRLGRAARGARQWTGAACCSGGWLSFRAAAAAEADLVAGPAADGADGSGAVAGSAERTC